MILIFVFIFGLLIGSFLNVVALRWNSGIGLGGRSFCFSCGKELSALELVPVLSYVFQRGRCKGCKTHISPQYALGELSTGIVFASLFAVMNPLLSSKSLILYVIAAIIFSIYIVVTIYDLKHTIIPDPLSYSAIALALVFRFIAGGTLIDWLAGPILFMFFGGIWLLSKGRAMGFGDAKLVVSIGLLLGGAAGFSAIILAFWIGTVVSVTLLFLSRMKGTGTLFTRKKRLTMKSEVPFAPFLILGAWSALVFSLDLFHVLLFA